MSLAPNHPDLAVKKFAGGIKKDRTLYVVPEIAPENNVCVYNPDVVTLERAIKERVLYVEQDGIWQPAPSPRAGVFDRRLRSFETLLGRNTSSTTPFSQQEFAESYRGRKRIIYEKAVESLKINGVSQVDAKIKAFVKAEKGKHGSAPRVIQPRDPRYNVEVGKFLKPIEERMYKAIARVYGEKTVTKGLNARNVARLLHSKWISFRNPVALGLDAKRFDQHVSVSALNWEHRQWLRWYPSYRAELARLLRMQLRNVGRGYCRDGKLKYVVNGKRMSGDMNTGSGNCLLMCAMVHAYSAHVGVRIKLANNGDDCVVFMEAHDLNRFSAGLEQWFLEMGFQMTVEPPAYTFEKLEFCQSNPVYDGETYTMVRNLRAFTKDAVCLVPIRSDFTLRSWLGAVGDAGMSLTGGIPVWQEFYALYQRSAGALSSARRRVGAFLDQSSFETGMMMSAAGMNRKYGDVSAESRFSFWLATGLSPDHQLALESQYREKPNISWTDNVLKMPLHPPPMPGFTIAW